MNRPRDTKHPTPRKSAQGRKLRKAETTQRRRERRTTSEASFIRLHPQIVEKVLPFRMTFIDDEVTACGDASTKSATISQATVELEKALAGLRAAGDPPTATGLPLEIVQITLGGALIGVLMANRRLLVAGLAAAHREQYGHEPDYEPPDNLTLSVWCSSLLQRMESECPSWIAHLTASQPYEFFLSDPSRLLGVLASVEPDEIPRLLANPNAQAGVARIKRQGTREQKKRLRAILQGALKQKSGRPRKQIDDLAPVRFVECQLKPTMEYLEPGWTAWDTRPRHQRGYNRLTARDLIDQYHYTESEAAAIARPGSLQAAAIRVLVTRMPGTTIHRLTSRASKGRELRRAQTTNPTSTALSV